MWRGKKHKFVANCSFQDPNPRTLLPPHPPFPSKVAKELTTSRWPVRWISRLITS